MTEITIVIPCYNEETRLPVRDFEDFLSTYQNISICFSNDGSKDNTLAVLNKIKDSFPEQVLINNLEINQGKAEAVRTGILKSKVFFSPEYIGFFDADLATPLEEVFFLKDQFSDNKKLVFGSRWSRLGVTIVRSQQRHYLGRIIATAISLALGLPTYDTQCGAKLFKSTICHQLFKEPFTSKWLFDVEIFARMINLLGREETQNQALEVALNNWHEVAGSKVTYLDGIKSFYFIWKIKRRYKL